MTRQSCFFMHTNASGLTLIELLAAIVLLSILGAVLATTWQDVRVMQNAGTQSISHAQLCVFSDQILENPGKYGWDGSVDQLQGDGISVHVDTQDHQYSIQLRFVSSNALNSEHVTSNNGSAQPDNKQKMLQFGWLYFCAEDVTVVRFVERESETVL